MRRRSSLIPAVLALAVLAGCGTAAEPEPSSAFEGISLDDPRDLPAGQPFDGGEGPASAPIDDGVAYRFALQHCGLLSPVDVDGSFWDAIDGVTPAGGPLDLETDPEMINATDGVIVVIGDEMRFRTASGSVVRFARQVGAKDFQPCM